MAYYALLPAIDLDDAAFIGDHPDDIGVKGWEFANPKPLANRFSAGAAYAMDTRKPASRRALYSWVDNAMEIPIVSAALAAILREQEGAEVEFLPIRILDRKGGLASEEYQIAHVLAQIDAIDLERSTFTLDELDPDCFQTWDKLELDRERVPEELELFTLKWIDKILFVGKDMMQRITSNKAITGVRFVPLEKLASYST